MPLFQKFGKENISNASSTKSSEQRRIRGRIVEQYPLLADHIDELFPAKVPICAVKCQNHITMITSKGEALFFQEREGPYFPTIRLLQQFPDILPIMQCDIGGCKFVLAGANIMCQGLTSKGGKVAPGLPEKAPVQIRIEGKRHPIAVGLTTMSSDDILEVWFKGGFF